MDDIEQMLEPRAEIAPKMGRYAYSGMLALGLVLAGVIWLRRR